MSILVPSREKHCCRYFLANAAKLEQEHGVVGWALCISGRPHIPMFLRVSSIRDVISAFIAKLIFFNLKHVKWALPRQSL
jgi:hypothetical protein